MKDYDVRSVFEQMELELIDSMKRNLSRHQKWETKEGMNWTMWQVEQLKTLEQFKKENQKIFKSKFTTVNNEIAKFLEDNYRTSGLDQEKAILKELAKGNVASKALDKGLEGSFFRLNTKKMNALINATTNDMKTAETAMLRMVNDQYRKTIFRAQVMANSGAFTLQQSIDAATKDFLKAGINCIQYKDGRRVNIATYAEMAIRTANKRAVLTSEGDARNAYGIHTVRISRYGQCSETCLPWQGRVYVDDKFSGGTKEEAKEKNLPLLSEAIDGGLFHPNCKHRSTTYFYDIKKSLGKLKDDGIENPPEEQEHRKNHLHIQQQKRLETGSLDQKNIDEAKERKEMWIEKDAITDIPEIKIVPEGQEMTFKKYTHKEIIEFANKNEISIDKYVSKKSKWSGRIRIEKNKSYKDWSCDIVISEETSPMIILHEQLHARSASYIKKEQYRNFRTIEEASVQLLTQEISQLEGIEIISSAYDEFADKLREINDIAGLYDNHLDFAIQLYSQDLSERNDWLEQKVYDKLMTEGNIDKLMKFNEIMNVMRMENPPWKLKK